MLDSQKLGLIYQILGYWSSVATITSIHAAIISLMIKVGAHFELLAEQIPEVDASDPNAEEHLDRFIQEYHDIFHFAKTISDINSVLWAGQLLPQAYNVCSCVTLTAFQPLSESGYDIFLGLAAIFDFFAYCWCGEQINFHSNRITIKMWDINWNMGTLKFRKKFLSSLIIFGHGYTAKLGGFIPLRLQSFLEKKEKTEYYIEKTWADLI
ncbi:uncharacterized protein LOC123295271 [Chrysoperla carnea]|uniref:uncharacterized protein LOC123295271 n=1 Tax=Chrysoperla carnea TaxID=189513 RepID=UPI001D087987|nr:uncharacterized protein LOC123295271 [Chrysoperla carnea]